VCVELILLYSAVFKRLQWSSG